MQKGLQVLACGCEDESQKKIFKDHDKAEQPFYSPQGVQVISKFSDSQIKIDSCFWWKKNLKQLSSKGPSVPWRHHSHMIHMKQHEIVEVQNKTKSSFGLLKILR